MNQFDFQAIRPLITAEQVQGRTLKLDFTCPVKGTTVSSSHMIEAPSSAGEQLQHRTKRAFFNSIRGPVASAIRSLFGNSTAGRMAGDVASQVAYVAATPSSTMPFSDQQKQSAAVAAFRSVAGKFVWDVDTKCWVGA